MQDLERRVCHLRINSQDESSIVTDINSLQDAFNIASFPGLPPNGLLLIKKLDLGVFRTGSTAITLSNLIDKKIRAIPFQPVCVDKLERGEVNVVWFSDASEAVFALLNLIVSHQQPQAWYWRVIFPSLSTDMNPTDILNVICQHLQQSETKPVILAQVMQALIFTQRLEFVFQTLSLPLAQLLAREVGLYPHLVGTPKSEIVSERPYLPEFSSVWSLAIESAVLLWGRDDPRSHWLVYCALLTINPALIGSRLVWPNITAVIEAVGPVAESNSVGLISQTGAISEFVTTMAVQDEVGVDEPDKDGLEESEQAFFEKKTGDSEIENSYDTGFKFSDLQGFRYSGLGFVIPLLELLSIEELLADNPVLVETNFPVRIVRLVAKRMGVENDHAILQALPEDVDASDVKLGNFVAPASWKALLGSKNRPDSWLYRFVTAGDLAGDFETPSMSTLETVFQLLLSRFLYRQTKMSLRSLIKRDGRLVITRTHLDFVFNLDQLDIRIRKAGLDIDPGWVSWLGMVVQFHYKHRGSDDA